MRMRKNIKTIAGPPKRKVRYHPTSGGGAIGGAGGEGGEGGEGGGEGGCGGGGLVGGGVRGGSGGLGLGASNRTISHESINRSTDQPSNRSATAMLQSGAGIRRERSLSHLAADFGVKIFQLSF